MDIEKFKVKFIQEAIDLINQLELSLIDHEENLGNKEAIHQIFRVMHTLKGVSSMYGFNHIGDLAHDLETIFDLIRENKQEFTSSIFNITLKTVDQFRKLLDDEKLTNEENQQVQKELLSEIEQIVKKVFTPSNPSPATDLILEEQSDTETYYIIFRPTEDLIFRCINVLRLFEELVDIGEYKIVNHTDHDQQPPSSNVWGIYLVTDQGIEAIEDILMFVLDECEIIKLSNGNLFNSEKFIANPHSFIANKDKELTHYNIKEVEKTTSEINQHNSLRVSPKEEFSQIIIPQDANPISIPPVNSSKESPPEYPTSSRINVDSEKLDRLMYLVSELVTTKSQLSLAVMRKDYTSLLSIAEKIENLSSSFRENALNIRLVPIAEMLFPFKRLIRDLSLSLGKEVRFITEGIDTELDKNVMDNLSEPIMHILRNCIDHGIEKPEERSTKKKPAHGSIKFVAFYTGANVCIQIHDDGAGLNTEKIKSKALEKGFISQSDELSNDDIHNLVFKPGFSTSATITDISGRGVGMDIVKKKIEELRGEIEINSEPDAGTTFTIKLHQTLSIMDSLLILVDDASYLIPMADIEFCDQIKTEALYHSHNNQVVIGDDLIPYVSLRQLFAHSSTLPKKEKLIIVNKNDKRIAIVADKIIGEHQAVLKPLGEVFQAQQFLSGASMLGDGSLALMLDTNKLSNNI